MKQLLRYFWHVQMRDKERASKLAVRTRLKSSYRGAAVEKQLQRGKNALKTLLALPPHPKPRTPNHEPRTQNQTPKAQTPKAGINP